uniref:Retroviral polymerase SH3-like domain-containing protein n=1 Tax=Tanacetum cinerariifolium TaxID=118510 RepID=A0A6L2P2W8_TANCI|nr:hypothetical protein [Tanacetum cinerariifolium]
MLLMALPNENILTFSQYKDAKTLFEAIQARFDGNDATKKTQRTFLKQMHENFNAPSTEPLDSIFNRLQKTVSQLAILGENISQEDLNMKFLRISKLLNKKSKEHTNEVDTTSIQISVVSTPVSIVSSPDNIANLSDATVYAFLANQPNGYQLVHEDLEQIHEDDPKQMDLKWQIALLSMRARRPRDQDSSRKTMIVEDTSSKDMVAIDRAGFDWSYMADDEVPTKMALMAFSDSEVHNSKTCSNTCLKSFKTLKTQSDNLRIEFNKSEFDLATYKGGLAYVEEQLVFYKKNEVVFYDQIDVLKRDALIRDSEITALNLQIEKLKKEKESNQIKIDNFENASKSLDILIRSQITDNSKTWLGFKSCNAVAPPSTGLFAPPSIDLSNSGLEENQHPEFKGYGPKDSKSVCIDTLNEIKKAFDAPIIEDGVSDSDEDESNEMVLKSDNVQHKPEQANQPRKMVQKPVLKNRTIQREVRPVWKNAMRTNHQNFSNSRRNFAPTAVLTKSGIVPISTAMQSSSREAAPVSAAKPINIDASKPLGTPQDALKDQGYFDSGCSRHMKGNISYLIDFKEHDRGYIAFGRGAKCGKITGKGTRTATKDETSRIFKSFITEIENLVEKKVKIIRCDNRTKFKKSVMNEFCKEKGIKREYSVARTPQQNKAEAVSNACYVQNRVLVVKPQLKTPYELFKGRSPALSFMRPFRCHVSILNSLDQLEKFDGKSDERIFVGYSTTSKAFRVYNIKTRKVEENLHITFLENKPMISGGGPEWLFDINALSKLMNYAPVSAANEIDNHERPNAESSTKTVNTAGPVSTATPTHAEYPNVPLMPDLEDVGIFDDAYDDRDKGTEVDYNNLETVISVSLIPSTRIHKDHPK